MRNFFAVIYILLGVLLLVGPSIAEEKFSRLPTKEYYFVYEKTTNVKNLQLSTIYTVAQVEKAMQCDKYIVMDVIYGKDRDRGILLLGTKGKEAKMVLMLLGIEEEHRV